MAKVRIVIRDECGDEAVSPWLRFPFEDVTETELELAEMRLAAKWDFEESQGYYFERDFKTAEEKEEAEEELERLIVQFLEEDPSLYEEEAYDMAFYEVYGIDPMTR